MRVLVCGSRDFVDTKRIIDDTLTIMHLNESPISCIISGGARGADAYGEVWSLDNAVQLARYPAQWKHGKAAGHIRNKQMLDEGKPDLVIAFWDGESLGTKNMISQAEKAGVPIKVIHVDT